MSNPWPVPSLVLQKLPAPALAATTKMTLPAPDSGTTAGLVVSGMDYAYVCVRRTRRRVELVQHAASTR